MNQLPKHVQEDLTYWNSLHLDQRKTLSFRDRTKHFSGVRLTFPTQLVIKLITSGAPNKRIADLMNISQKTVEKHRQVALYATKTHCAACLTHWAIKNELVVAGEYLLF